MSLWPIQIAHFLICQARCDLWGVRMWGLCSWKAYKVSLRDVWGAEFWDTYWMLASFLPVHLPLVKDARAIMSWRRFKFEFQPGNIQDAIWFVDGSRSLLHIFTASIYGFKMMTVLPAIKPVINTIIKSFHFSRWTGEQFVGNPFLVMTLSQLFSKNSLNHQESCFG